MWPKVCQLYLNKIAKNKTHLTEEDTQMIYKHMKNCPTSYNYYGSANLNNNDIPVCAF